MSFFKIIKIKNAGIFRGFTPRQKAPDSCLGMGARSRRLSVRDSPRTEARLLVRGSVPAPNLERPLRLRRTAANRRGFTLIEGMVAVAILASAITAPLTIAHQGLRSAFLAKDQITAFYLGQSVIERIRQVRDSNKLAGKQDINKTSNYWLFGMNNCVNAETGGGNYCTVNILVGGLLSVLPSNIGGTPRFSVCSETPSPPYNSVCSRTRYDAATGVYSYIFGAGGAKPFSKFVIETRIINDPAGADPNEARVIVTVKWASSYGLRSITLNEHLRNI